MNVRTATSTLAALLALALPWGCVARATDSAIPTMQQGHMQMTVRQPQQPGDRARADAIVAAAKRVMAEYPTVDAAEAAGFSKFLPKIPLPIEHYTSRKYALEAWFGHFDPMHPTSLIFQRTGTTLKLVGVMYTASNAADRGELDQRVPLSFGTWHRHVDYCRAPKGTPIADLLRPDAQFGLQGSIETADACAKAGGTFVPLVFGWMVHVWPNETTDDAVWAVDAHHSMDRGSM
jgi:hypothetical protein